MNSAPATNVAGALSVLDLFSAACGGWSLGMHRAGFHTIAACEVIDWRRALYSQNNPGVPVYDDVTTLTAERLIRDGVGLPRIIVGSPPCQDISSANTKGKGVDGERSGLYFEAVRLIDECRPDWFALENSANLRTRGADRVIDALEAIGYACWPFVVSAGDVGANHERKRSWLVGCSLAYANGDGRDVWREGWRRWVDASIPNDISDTAQDGWREGRARGCSVAIAGVPEQARGDADAKGERCASWSGSEQGECGEHNGRVAGNGAAHGVDANSTSIGYESGRARGYWPDGNGAASIASSQSGNVPHANNDGEFRCAIDAEMGVVQALGGYAGNSANSNEARQAAGLQESSPRSTSQPGTGCSSERGDDGEGIGQVGGCESVGVTTPEPWADWNSGLAHHLRVDDGLSAWVAQSRIEVGGPRGTVAASLLVEAFGDAVCPQIPEAIGRAILRVEAALAVVYGAPVAANDNNNAEDTHAAA